MALKALSLFAALAAAQLVPSPQNCYDFTSNSVTDGCGAVHLT